MTDTRKPARILVRTIYGDAEYEFPDWRTAKLGGLDGFEIDVEMLDGATLTTDPARFSTGWTPSTPDPAPVTKKGKK